MTPADAAYAAAVGRLPHALNRLRGAWDALQATLNDKYDSQNARDAFSNIWVETDRLLTIIEAVDRQPGGES